MSASIPMPPIDFTNDERNAMRAYLQRCEVRLSTMHRVVTAFVSGAALMVLIPVFFKDVVSALLQLLLNDFGNRYASLGAAGWALTGLLYALLAYTLGFAFYIPIRALYLVFKDIVDFYITINTPGAPEEGMLNPAFALTGVAFSVDESERVKRSVMAYQYMPQSIDFMLPFSIAKRAEYFEPMLRATRTHKDDPALIIPATRTTERLQRDGILPPILDDAYAKNVDYFNVALGIGRSYDRRLVEEVAKTEMSLVRHILYLRRLIFRYVATLLIFVWTLLIMFLTISVVQVNAVQTAHAALTFVVLAAGCLLWALPVRMILHRPIVWIYRPIQQALGDRISLEKQIDPQISRLEQSLTWWHIGAVVAASMALVLALAALLFF